MASKLPDEVLLLIQDHLFWPRQPNLLLVSRRFYRLFLPRLYRFVHCSTLGGRHKIIAFIRSALRNPDIARSIQGVSLPNLYNDTSSDPVKEQDLSDIRHLVELVSHDSSEQAQWEEDLQRGMLDAWATLLLTRAENLNYVAFESLEDPPYLRRTLNRVIQTEAPFDVVPALRHLQDLAIGNRDSDYPFGPQEALPFFRLPSLRSYRADTFLETYSWEDPSQDDEDEALKAMSGVISLRLMCSNGKRGMHKLITACANLESFEYSHQDMFAKGEYMEYFVPSAFYAPLLMQKHSLVKLHFNDRCRHMPFQVGSEHSRRNEVFGSLSGFTALKDVRIRLPNLVGGWWETESELADLLPSSLETLFLTHCWDKHLDRLIPQLERVIADREARFNRLRELRVQPYILTIISQEEFNSPSGSQPPPTMKDEDIRKFDRLRDMCLIAGIEFSIDQPQSLRTMSVFLPWHREIEGR